MKKLISLDELQDHWLIVVEGEEYKVAPLEEEKWQQTKAGLLAKQVYSIPKLIKFTQALDLTKKNFGQNRLIEINAKTHPKLMSWYKEQNIYIIIITQHL